MDYEKKYKEAFEVAQKLYQDCPNGKNDRLYHTTDLEKMFPELRESEDEKIRKELIEHVKDQQSSFISAPDCRDKYEEEENNKYNAWIAWLEKQGGKKPIEEVNGEDYGIDGLWHAMNILEKTLGKVDGYQTDDGILSHQCAITAVKKLYKQKTSEWSKENETELANTIIMLKEGASLHFNKKDIAKAIDWLKSLRPQPKQEWSQNDIDMIDWLICCCEKEHEELCNDKYGHQDIVSDLKRDCRKKWDWLESLKNRVAPQNTWKPSKEQIIALRWVLNNVPYNKHKEEISGLLDQIKEL